MAKKHKFKRGDFVIVYNCKQVLGGCVGFITDRDADSFDYLVQDVLRPDIDYWIPESGLDKILFEKPTFFQKLKMLFRR